MRHSPGSISRGGRLFTTGTKSSNPSSSSGESCTKPALTLFAMISQRRSSRRAPAISTSVSVLRVPSGGSLRFQGPVGSLAALLILISGPPSGTPIVAPGRDPSEPLSADGAPPRRSPPRSTLLHSASASTSRLGRCCGLLPEQRVEIDLRPRRIAGHRDRSHGQPWFQIGFGG